MQKTSRDTLLLHVIFWILNTGLTFYMWQLPYYNSQKHWTFVLEILAGHSISIVYFYSMYAYIVPRYLIRKRYLYYGLLSALAILFNVFGCAYVWNSFHYIPDLFREDQRVGIVFSCIMYAGVATGMKIMDLWQQSEEQKQSLEKALRETELMYLQSQMSPHFLFNTLNNIYGLSLKKAPETRVAISHLKDIMLYFQHFEKGGKIPIAEELQKLQAFIGLHQLRSHTRINFVSQLSNVSESASLEPMLLLPSVENAIKHGDVHSPIHIRLEIKGNKLAFDVTNRTSQTKRKDAVGGIGLANVARRLELLYPQRHSLLSHENDGYFYMNLKLEL